MKDEIGKERIEIAEWEKVSHVAYSTCYITSYKATINGKIWYKHATVKRTPSGRVSNKPGKITYSETMDSPDVSISKVVNKMIALAKSQYSNLNN